MLAGVLGWQFKCQGRDERIRKGCHGADKVLGDWNWVLQVGVEEEEG